MTTSPFSQFLWEQREERGLTQEQFARLLGITRTTLSYLETGRTHPTLGTLRKISRALGVDLDTLEDLATTSPKAPLAREPVEVFDHRLRAVASEREAAALRDAARKDYESLRRWYRALKNRGAPEGDRLLAAKEREAARQRFAAATLLWSEFVTEGDTSRTRPVERRVARDGVEETSRRLAAERDAFQDVLFDEIERQRIEDAGEAS